MSYQSASFPCLYLTWPESGIRVPTAQPRDHRSHPGIPTSFPPSPDIAIPPPKASLNVCSSIVGLEVPAWVHHCKSFFLLTSPSAALSDHVPHSCYGNSVETPHCLISSYHIYAQNPVLGPRCPREGSQSPLPAVFISPAALSIPDHLSDAIQVWQRQTSKFTWHFTECPQFSKDEH